MSILFLGRALVFRFQKDFRKVASWRVWGSLIAVLKWLLPLRTLLCRYWKAERYKLGVSESQTGHRAT